MPAETNTGLGTPVEIPQDPLAAAELRVGRLYTAMAAAREQESKHGPTVVPLDLYMGRASLRLDTEQPA